jgi:hypothetical protein
MRSLTKGWILLIGTALLLGALPARAQLSIEITGAGAQRIPLAVVAFAGEESLAPGLTAIVLADLERTGMFRGIEVPPLTPQPTETSAVDYIEWRARLADALVLGSVAPLKDGRIEVRFRLFDVVKRVPLGGVAYALSAPQLRATAHRIADFVYEKLTGERGMFSTRIAYVLKRATRYELQIADADGMGAESALASAEPIISPAWSPDGRRIAYVSFENKRAIVFVHSLIDGKRQVVANFRGTNSAPAWSPGWRSSITSIPTAAACCASRNRLASTPSRASRRTASGCISPPIGAAVRRSTACRRAAAMQSASASTAAIMRHRGSARTARVSRTSRATKADSRSRCSISRPGRCGS